MNGKVNYADLFRENKVEGFVIVDEGYLPVDPADWSVVIRKLSQTHVGIVVFESERQCADELMTERLSNRAKVGRIRYNVLVSYLNRMRRASDSPFIAMTHDKQGGFAMLPLEAK